MADTLIEQTRALHEDVERLERLIVKDFKQDTKTHREKLQQSQRVRKRMDQMQESAKKLLCVYEDEDKQRREEIEALGGDDRVYSRFYDRLKEVRDYHRRFPSTDFTEAENDDEALKEEPHVEFTGEEGYGRYLDLHQLFQLFVNSKFSGQTQEKDKEKASKGGKDASKADADIDGGGGGSSSEPAAAVKLSKSREIVMVGGAGGEGSGVQQPLDYMGYIGAFADLGAVPKQHKGSKEYREYLTQLLAYLESFYSRTQPLAQLSRQTKKVEEETEQLWSAGELPGWEDKGLGGGGSSATPALDLEAFETAEELAALGADKLKEALAALGLKCGGAPMDRAKRLFLTKHTPLSQLDKKLFAPGVVPPSVVSGRSTEELGALESAALQVATLEARVRKMAEVLSAVAVDTKGRIEKKQSQTYEELQAEQEEGDADAMDADSDDENAFIYNPLKLPLGFDGKPIPYWLYKLHGLNHEFKCEICGNFSYMGRRAYEKHFKEWRHQNGMRALGIPNTKSMFEVTMIDEALALWQSMQDKGKGGFKADVDEEFEDSAGNVYNKKTYEDMQRQGLI